MEIRERQSISLEALKLNFDCISSELEKLNADLRGSSNCLMVLNSLVNITDFKNGDQLTILSRYVASFFDETQNNTKLYRELSTDPNLFAQYYELIGELAELLSTLYQEFDRSHLFSALLSAFANNSKDVSDYQNFLMGLFEGNVVEISLPKPVTITPFNPASRKKITLTGVGPNANSISPKKIADEESADLNPKDKIYSTIATATLDQTISQAESGLVDNDSNENPVSKTSFFPPSDNGSNRPFIPSDHELTPSAGFKLDELIKNEESRSMRVLPNEFGTTQENSSVLATRDPEDPMLTPIPATLDEIDKNSRQDISSRLRPTIVPPGQEISQTAEISSTPEPEKILVSSEQSKTNSTPPSSANLPPTSSNPPSANNSAKVSSNPPPAANLPKTNSNPPLPDTTLAAQDDFLASLPLPSDYLMKKNRPGSQLVLQKRASLNLIPEASELPSKRLTIPEKTTLKITKSARSRIWNTLGGLALIVLGGIGIKGSPAQPNQMSEQPASAVPAASASEISNTPTPAPAFIDNSENQQAASSTAENQNIQHGMYRVNTSSADYQKLTKYLIDNKLFGLEGISRDLVGRIAVHFSADQKLAQEMKAQGKLVFTDQDNNDEINNKFFAEFLRMTQEEKLENGWVQKVYFKKMQKDFNSYLSSGKWPAFSKDAQIYYNALKNPQKVIQDKDIIGYSVDLDSSRNTALKQMKRAVPSFFKTFVEVNQEMQQGKDPANLATYNDSNEIKRVVCSRIDQKAEQAKGDYRSGLKFMHHKWCNGLPNGPENYLNQSLQFTVPIRKAAPINQPSQSPTQVVDQPAEPGKTGQFHNSIINRFGSFYQMLKENVFPRKSPARLAEDKGNKSVYVAPVLPPKSTYQPKIEPSIIIDPSIYQESIDQKSPKSAVTPEPSKPEKSSQGLISRMFDRVKSSLKLGQYSAKAQHELRIAQMTGEEFARCQATKEDLPMNTWKDTAKSFLGI